MCRSLKVALKAFFYVVEQLLRIKNYYNIDGVARQDFPVISNSQNGA
jgi:hypothetical protein